MIDLRQYLYERVSSIIQDWNEEDIYAISFFVYTNEAFDDVFYFAISYNTESAYKTNDLISFSAKELERKWNYAFWIQNEHPIIEDNESICILYQWLKEKGIEDIGIEDENNMYDDSYAYIGKGPNGLYELIQEIAEVAKLTHIIIKRKFSKDLPIIIHDLEYAWYMIEATKKANPEGQADEFFKDMKELGIFVE